MKPWRIWLVVVLALLLPVRGAFAAALMCAPAGGPAPHAQHHHVRDAAHAGCDEPGAGDHDKCSVCAVCFAATALPPGMPALCAPPGATADFAEPLTPPPMLLASGLERPPRAG